MFAAMASMLLHRKVRPDVAMTGEITLSGAVLPVGGIREKALAARRYGISTFLLPELNAGDVEELPEEVRKDMTFVPVKHLDEVLALALPPPPPAETPAPAAAEQAAAEPAAGTPAAGSDGESVAEPDPEPVEVPETVTPSRTRTT
jgi:predicted ATP-dependent protease